MKIQDLEFLKLLPRFMQKDEAVQGLSKGIEEFLQEAAKKVSTLSTWNQIENLSDDELMELAWELDIDWYDYKESREARINQIKNASLIKKRRGTKWAVAQIVSDVFGAAYVKEWFEFNGNPFEFEVITTNPNVTQEMYDRMVFLIEKAKNVRSILKRISYSHEVLSEIEIASQVHDGTFTLPICGVAWCGDYRLFNLAPTDSLSTNIKIERSIGTFSLPVCGKKDTLLNIGPHQALSMKAQMKGEINSFIIPMCGQSMCGEEKGGKE